jgi:hypothetical protein
MSSNTSTTASITPNSVAVLSPGSGSGSSATSRAFCFRISRRSSGVSSWSWDFRKSYSFCLMVEASDHGYVLRTRPIHVTRYRVRIQHQCRLAILNQFSVLIYAVCRILPSFVSYQGCVVHRWVFGVPCYTSLLEWKYAIQFSNEYLCTTTQNVHYESCSGSSQLLFFYNCYIITVT